MKKYLVLPVLMVSCGVFANDVADMTKEEVSVKHIELYDAVMANANNDTCKTFNDFNHEARRNKKIELLDTDATERSLKARIACNEIGYVFKS
ncbi:hypothetical protein BS049_RS22955 [Vibrio parahaemolyticus]|nr:hypothetical protein [Vibrio parahaemolyticus]